jgi:hypothetical protein
VSKRTKTKLSHLIYAVRIPNFVQEVACTPVTLRSSSSSHSLWANSVIDSDQIRSRQRFSTSFHVHSQNNPICQCFVVEDTDSVVKQTKNNVTTKIISLTQKKTNIN